MVWIALSACSDSGSPPADESPTPEVVVRTDAATATECEHGGSVVSSGLDGNRNGQLDDAEIAEAEVICNDASPAPDGYLVRIDEEPAGTNCADGGSAVRAGTDANGDGILQDDEVAATTYVCDGTLLTRMAGEPAGQNCAGGGIAFFIGRDDDGDGTLSDAEVEWTQFECSDVISRDVSVATTADLELIQHVRAISGALLIDGTSLAEVDLPMLELVGGRLVIGSNGLLARVSMPLLSDIGGYFELADNAQLSTVDISRLEVVTGDFDMRANPVLADMSGLASLFLVGFDFRLVNNQSLAAARIPEIVHEDVVVTGNSALAQLDVNFVEDVRDIEIRANGLTDLALDTLSLFGDPRMGNVTVSGNPALTDLRVAARFLTSIRITGNAALDRVSLQLGKVEADVVTRDNERLRFYFLDTNFLEDNIEIGGWLEIGGPIETFIAPFASSRHEVGNLRLRGTLLTDFDNTVRQVFGAAAIEDNPRLTRIALDHVGSGLSLVNNDQLGDFWIEDDLEGFAGDIRIIGNERLGNLAGLQRVTSFPGSLIVADNPSLLRTAIYAPTRIDGDLIITRNASLEHIDLDAVSTIAGHVSITENQMELWSGLDALETVQSGFTIAGNPGLVDIDLPLLLWASLQISGHAQLVELRLPALTYGSYLNVMDNPQLPACAVEELFAGLPEIDCYQEGNDEEAICE